MKSITFILSLIVLGLASSSIASPAEKKTSAYFDSVKNNSEKLYAFLYDMPKGGDIHNHIDGASIAENMLHYAHHDRFCINPTTYAVFSDPTCARENLLHNAITHDSFKEELIDTWSMRHFNTKNTSGHDHFFAAFSKFIPIVQLHGGEVLSEIVERAALQNEIYLELIVTPGDSAAELGKQVGWDPELFTMREKLLASDFNKIIRQISQKLDQDESKMRTELACQTQHPKSGCDIKILYQYPVFREQPPERVFAQLLAGFESANKDARMVGVNIVQPEDGFISMRDYKLHMHMIAFFHRLYPKVKISLHAGELNDIAPPEGLKFHIREAVEVAHADRIGHGVDIAHENDADQLLKQMVAKQILVEINLSSNAFILGIEGQQHPLPLYMRYGVPVALATDDEGISRENLSQQYLRAVVDYDFNYATLKTFARNSIGFAFIPDKNLWLDNQYKQIVSECRQDNLGSDHPSSVCQAFLNANEKAKTQWKLEAQFVKFENRFLI